MENRKETFKRARSSQQRHVRSKSILVAAGELLAVHAVRDISLREISRRVGLSKANVVRYFETREAIFFELLNMAFQDWLDELPAELAVDSALTVVNDAAVVAAISRSLAKRPGLCKLWSALASELEVNISAEAVRKFKLEHQSKQERLAEILERSVSGLDFADCRYLVSLCIVTTAGLFPFANPSTSVQTALADPALSSAKFDFETRLSAYLLTIILGIRQQRPPA